VWNMWQFLGHVTAIENSMFKGRDLSANYRGMTLGRYCNFNICTVHTVVGKMCGLAERRSRVIFEQIIGLVWSVGVII
jgi:hypothetical protein